MGEESSKKIYSLPMTASNYILIDLTYLNKVSKIIIILI